MRTLAQISAVIALVAAGTLAGCAGQVRGNISAFSNLAGPVTGKTVIIVPSDAAKARTLEFADYSKHLSQRLAAAGFQVIPYTGGSQQTDYVATFDYGIDDGHQETTTVDWPTYGPIGGGTSYTNGTVTTPSGGTAFYNGTTTTSPSWGQTGSTTDTYSRTVYNRILRLGIWQPNGTDQPAKVYESTLRSPGSCGNVGEVIDPMLDMMFEGFPASRTDQTNISFDPPSGC